MDYIFVEGPHAFFRTGLVILRALKNDISLVRDVPEFTMAFDNKIKGITDLDKFRDLMRGVYLNQEILDVCRSKNIEYKQNRYYEGSHQRSKIFEKCLESNPYCHWERNAKFKEFNERVKRVYSLSESLKFNFFDPFKNAADSRVYDYLKRTDDKQFVNEDRFTTYTSKKDTMISGAAGERLSAVLERGATEEDSILHQTYLEKMISGNLREAELLQSKAVEKDFRTGPAPEARPSRTLKPEASKKAAGQTRNNGGVTWVGEESPPRLRKISSGSELTMLRKLGSQLVDVPKAFFENQSPNPPEAARITLARQRQMEKNLVIARCAHICAFEQYEYIHREIDIEARKKYFLIVNSILYKYLGEEIKNEHQQTLKVISDQPRLMESSIEHLKVTSRTRRQFPRQSLDRWPKKCSRFNSMEIGRGLVNHRVMRGRFMPEFFDRSRQFGEDPEQPRPKKDSMPELLGGQMQEISVDDFVKKYKHAYNFDQEALKKDVMRLSKKTELSEVHPDEMGTSSL